MIVEFINGEYFDIDSTYPESEFYKDETISVTSNNSTMFLHKSSQLFGYFIEVHTPKHGLVAIFREIARYHV